MKFYQNSTLESSVGRVIIVDDDTVMLKALCETLGDRGYETSGFTTPGEALEAIGEETFDLMLTDLQMPEMDGIRVMQRAKEIAPNLVVIIVTGQGTIDTAVKAMKLGALDYVLKPFKTSTLLPVLSRAMEVRRLQVENIQLRESLAIYELSMTAAFSLAESTILEKVADATIKGLNADELSIMLASHDGKELSVAIARGENRGQILGYRTPINKGIAGWVATQKQPVILEGEIDDPRFEPIYPRTDISSSISVPMLVGGKVIGVLSVNAIQRHPFSQGEVKALNILVNIAVASLENARLHEDVKQAEKKYRSIFENAAEGIFQTNPEGCFFNVNPAMAHMLGFNSPEELISEVTDIEKQLYVDANRRSEYVRMMKNKGYVPDFEFRAYRKDGKVIWIREKSKAVKNKNGRVLWYEGICEDITEKKKAEEELHEAKQRLEKIAQGITDGVMLLDSDLTVIWANDAIMNISDKKMEDVLGRKCFSLINELDSPCQGEDFICPVNEVIKNGKAYTATRRRKIQDKDCFIEDSVYPIIDKDGEIYQFVHLTKDITEFKKLEQQYLQAQKMESVGRLAGGVAHDFNNLLTAILGYAEMSLVGLEDDNPIKEYIDEIKSAGTRASSLTRQLLAFSRKETIQPMVLDLNETVKEMDKMIRRIIGENIELVTMLEPDLFKVKMDPGQFEQVIMNLIVNASDAMPSGGKLIIETVNIYLSEDYGREHGVKIKPGPFVMISVSDTGGGIEKKIVNKIFEPFFTTKDRAKGTGLGLSTVYGIVKQNNGYVWVYSEKGEGSTFKVCLPSVSEGEETEWRKKDGPKNPEGMETILLVEDNEVVLRVAKDSLRRYGYKVLKATGPGEAMRISEEHNDTIHLMLTDVIMPEMSGHDLAEKILSLRPKMKIVYMSGYTDNAVVHHGILKKDVSFIQKPFSPKTLAFKIREVLDTDGPTKYL